MSDQPDADSRTFANELFSFLSQATRDLSTLGRELTAGALQQMQLVSRDEFEVQKSVLLNARIQLAELDERLAELENRLAAKPTPTP